ncbi:MAG: ferrous iron transport protein A [Planctomycetia bacterium]|nr:ferrous iron transport protein A [Planctomycetia bacterium]
MAQHLSVRVPLPMLQQGESARIAEVLGASAFAHRLTEMGLRAGITVQMVRYGSPCILRVGAQRLCLRTDDLAAVLVEVVEPVDHA